MKIISLYWKVNREYLDDPYGLRHRKDALRLMTASIFINCWLSVFPGEEIQQKWFRFLYTTPQCNARNEHKMMLLRRLMMNKNLISWSCCTNRMVIGLTICFLLSVTQACPIDHYKEGLNGASCQPCPEHSNALAIASNNIEQCICTPGTTPSVDGLACEGTILYGGGMDTCLGATVTWYKCFFFRAHNIWLSEAPFATQIGPRWTDNSSMKWYHASVMTVRLSELGNTSLCCVHLALAYIYHLWRRHPSVYIKTCLHAVVAA